MRQGHHRHMVAAYHCVSLCLNDGRAPRQSATQVCNKQRSQGRTTRVQRPGRDQIKPRQGPHPRITGRQVGDVAIVQGGQGNEQTRVLAHNRILRQ